MLHCWACFTCPLLLTVSITLYWCKRLQSTLDSWTVWCSAWLDQIVPVRPYSADLQQRSTTSDDGCSFRSAPRLSARSSVVHSVHCWLHPCRCQTWSLATSVRRRLSGLYERASWRCPSCSPSALNMPSESQWSPFESNKNTGHVPWLSTSAIQTWHSPRTHPVILHPSSGDSAWPGRRYWQPAVSGRACRISFQQRLLPTVMFVACGPVFVGRCHQDISPGLLSVAWTIVKHCFLASRTNCSVTCSPYRTLPPGW